MMVWLSMSCMYVRVRTASGGTSYLATSAQGMASRSRAPERATQASRSNGGIAVGQKYYPRAIQTSIKARPASIHHGGYGGARAGGGVGGRPRRGNLPEGRIGEGEPRTPAP